MNNLLFSCGASRDIEGQPMSIFEAKMVFEDECGGNCADCPALVIEVRDKGVVK